MGKIVVGIGGLLLAIIAFLYGLGAEPISRNSYSPDPFLLEKITIFFGLDLPRILYLGLTFVWAGSAIGLIATGVTEHFVVSEFATKLNAGVTPLELLKSKVEEYPWGDESQRLSARAILNRSPYPRAVQAAMTETDKPLAHVVLAYKVACDQIAAICELIRQAGAKASVSTRDLPEPSIPTVRVTSSGLFASLNVGDLIVAYAGELVQTSEELQERAVAADGEESIELLVLRYVPLTHNHPLVGGNTYAWQAYLITMRGGRLSAGLTDIGTATGPIPSGTPSSDQIAWSEREVPATPTRAEATTRSEPPAASPTPVAPGPAVLHRFRCPRCGKSLKCDPSGVGRSVTCPSPPRSTGCGFRFLVPEPKSPSAAATPM